MLCYNVIKYLIILDILNEINFDLFLIYLLP